MTVTTGLNSVHDNSRLVSLNHPPNGCLVTGYMTPSGPSAPSLILLDQELKRAVTAEYMADYILSPWRPTTARLMTPLL